MALTLQANGIDLVFDDQAEITSITKEIIWSSDTGRSVTAKMLGEPVAEKYTVGITWHCITTAQMGWIEQALKSGYFSFSFPNNDRQEKITAYRGSLNKGVWNGLYYVTVEASVIQR